MTNYQGEKQHLERDLIQYTQLTRISGITISQKRSIFHSRVHLRYTSQINPY